MAGWGSGRIREGWLVRIITDALRTAAPDTMPGPKETVAEATENVRVQRGVVVVGAARRSEERRRDDGA